MKYVLDRETDVYPVNARYILAIPLLHENAILEEKTHKSVICVTTFSLILINVRSSYFSHVIEANT